MKHVLFLCTGNYYRSRMAEIYFNHLAENYRLEYRATSKAILEDLSSSGNVGPIASQVAEVCSAIGIKGDALSRYPESVSEHDFENAEIIIALDRHEHEPMLVKRYNPYAASIKYLDIADIHIEPAHVALVKISFQVNLLVDSLKD